MLKTITIIVSSSWHFNSILKFLLLIGRLTLYQRAICRWITRVTRATFTYWMMVYCLTICILSTCSRTRIYTFLINTCFILHTFSVSDTFRSTSRRSSYIRWQAWANCLSVILFAQTIWTTRRWNTRITWYNFNFYIK